MRWPQSAILWTLGATLRRDDRAGSRSALRGPLKPLTKISANQFITCKHLNCNPARSAALWLASVACLSRGLRWPRHYRPPRQHRLCHYPRLGRNRHQLCGLQCCQSPRRSGRAVLCHSQWWRFGPGRLVGLRRRPQRRSRRHHRRRPVHTAHLSHRRPSDRGRQCYPPVRPRRAGYRYPHPCTRISAAAYAQNAALGPGGSITFTGTLAEAGGGCGCPLRARRRADQR